MKGFVQGADRQQTTLLPECLDDWVDESNPVRAVDVFVDALELRDLGFDGVDPAATGRPAYHPSPMLKLYIYGYLNRVQSSRRLEREAGRNLEVMWLTGRLVPDHKTIADFRKDNGPAIRKVRAVRRRLPRDRPSDEGERRHRRQQVQSGQQSRQEFHAREDGAPACSNRGERGAVSEPARHRRPAGPNGSPRCEDGAPQGEACQAGDRDAALESDREGDVGLARSADFSDRP